jgi:hypothetical protein
MKPTLFDKVFGLDLEPVKFKLVKESGWSLEQADEVGNAYKGFLYLAASNPDQRLTPTKLVDEMWHTHILDTEKYAKDSQDIFGRFMHHWPYSGLMGDEDAARQRSYGEETSRLVRQTFGALADRPNWVNVLDPKTLAPENCYGWPPPPPSCCAPPACANPPPAVAQDRPVATRTNGGLNAENCYGWPPPPPSCCAPPACANPPPAVAWSEAVASRPGRAEVLALSGSGDKKPPPPCFTLPEIAPQAQVRQLLFRPALSVAA